MVIFYYHSHTFINSREIIWIVLNFNYSLGLQESHLSELDFNFLKDSIIMKSFEHSYYLVCQNQNFYTFHIYKVHYI